MKKMMGGKMGGSGKPGLNMKGDSMNRVPGKKAMAAGEKPAGKPIGRKRY